MSEFAVREEGDATDWTQPGVFRVADNVYRIPLPLPNDGLRAVNVYAIVDDGGLTMIDSGWALAESEQRLGRAIGALGFGFGDIRRFLVTHVHRDHYTQAVTIRRKFGNEVALGIGEKESLIAAGTPRALRGFEGLRSVGADPLIELFRNMDRPPPEPSDMWEMPDEWIEGRSDIKLVSRSLTAIPTPGHTAGHLVFRDDANVLTFTGDHVLPHITPSIGFEAVPVKLPLADYLGSLKLVRGMPDTAMLPAHGPARESVHARVDELLEHHDHRLDLSLAAVEKGASTAYEAAGLIGWTRREKKLLDLDPFNQMLAVFETSAHLNVLVLQGRLTSSKVDGVWRYSS
ncbi:MBL fold metallo-hydrolase [Fodinicola acaciae]|uniref:MBL fold metallo-hydrolase n=1 Tax=Fodinicola acaciae TaxID=2681555 RepID=UPI0013D49104|nr:MBL fold metallo-hydrolase [Fodinicola acaciae]